MLAVVRGDATDAIANRTMRMLYGLC